MNNLTITPQKSAVIKTNPFSDAWAVAGTGYGVLLGVVIVSGIIQFLVGLIPFIGFLLFPVVYGPLTAGVCKVYIDAVDGEPLNFGDMFLGFNRFLPNTIVAVLLFLPQLAIQFFTIVFSFDGVSETFRRSIPTGEEFGIALVTMAAAASVVFVVIYYGLLIVGFFSFYLMAEHELEPIDSIRLSALGVWKNFGGMLVLWLSVIVIQLIGVLMLCIGVLFTFPVALSACAVAYRAVFPRIDFDGSIIEPPSPDQYNAPLGLGS